MLFKKFNNNSIDNLEDVAKHLPAFTKAISEVFAGASNTNSNEFGMRQLAECIEHSGKAIEQLINMALSHDNKYQNSANKSR